jgi:hypothetical protein
MSIVKIWIKGKLSTINQVLLISIFVVIKFFVKRLYEAKSALIIIYLVSLTK